ncbi:hypothetical protein A0H81_00812 [Grifola frondosa]|uniref:Uncharacterized protein n=1 Tax=Grifola frondosa TaxID=5627 RepID=A0A1C7MPB0_GRIFR|nr:hypothetical protein A0H81_00812 [Grifola frondosa]
MALSHMFRYIDHDNNSKTWRERRAPTQRVECLCNGQRAASVSTLWTPPPAALLHDHRANRRPRAHVVYAIFDLVNVFNDTNCSNLRNLRPVSTLSISTMRIVGGLLSVSGEPNIHAKVSSQLGAVHLTAERLFCFFPCQKCF